VSRQQQQQQQGPVSSQQQQQQQQGKGQEAVAALQPRSVSLQQGILPAMCRQADPYWIWDPQLVRKQLVQPLHLHLLLLLLHPLWLVAVLLVSAVTDSAGGSSGCPMQQWCG
jgi:hypothetical protein